MIDVGVSQYTEGSYHPWVDGSEVYKKASHEEQASQHHRSMASALVPVFRFLP